MGALVDVRWAWDEALFRWLNGFDGLDALWVVASSREFGAVAGLLVALALLWRFRRRGVGAVLQVGAAVGATDLLGARVLKPLIGRLRPSFALDSHAVRVLSPAANSGSMPSLHAANAFALATVVTLVWPRAGIFALPLAVVIALSRVGCGVHWPSDVLVGGVLGAVMGCAARVVLERFAQSRPRLSFLSTPREQ